MNLTELSNVNRLLCTISGHKYKLVKKVTKHYKCNCCGSQVTTNAKGSLVSLTEELKLIHLGIETVIIKRNTRKGGSKKKAVA